jgi:hypothetical protein
MNDRQTAIALAALNGPKGHEIRGNAIKTFNSICRNGTAGYVQPRRDGKRGYETTIGTPMTFSTKRDALARVATIQSLSNAIVILSDR